MAKFISIFLLSIFTLLILVTRVQAQESPEEIAQKYGITFPIAELGGCEDINSCRTFCEDPVNVTTCISYAKSKGFYNEEQDARKTEILEKAKQILGCDSFETCQNFCSVPTNFDRCDVFARQQSLLGGHLDDPGKQEILEKAKQVLGCDSYASCASFCSVEENKDKCSQFAKEAGLRGGERSVGPGGCTSEATCRAFCSDPANYQICSGFATSSGGTFSGPGGCNSEASCRAYCSEHEDECRSLGGLGGSPPPGYDPQQMCNRTPNCAWQGNTCQCGFYGETEESRQKAGEYAAYCQANPDKCQSGQAGGFGSPEQRQEFESFCRQNPHRCQPPATGGYQGGYQGDPATECTKYGCSWTGSTCQCVGFSGGTYGSPQPGATTPPGSYYSPAPYSSPTNTSGETYNYQSPPPGGYSTDPATGCAQAGCSWTGSSCQCPTSGSTGASTNTPPPTTSEPAPQPTTSTTESQTQSSTPQPSPQVQGVSIVRNFFQFILDWIRR